MYLVTDDRGHCKLGVSRDVGGRFSVLQSHYPYRLRVAVTWGFETEDKARAVEAQVLAECPWPRLLGEWFAADDLTLGDWIDAFIRSRHSADGVSP